MECRQCGANLSADADECPDCGSDEIERYRISGETGVGLVSQCLLSDESVQQRGSFPRLVPRQLCRLLRLGWQVCEFHSDSVRRS